MPTDRIHARSGGVERGTPRQRAARTLDGIELDGRRLADRLRERPDADWLVRDADGIADTAHWWGHRVMGSRRCLELPRRVRIPVAPVADALEVARALRDELSGRIAEARARGWVA